MTEQDERVSTKIMWEKIKASEATCVRGMERPKHRWAKRRAANEWMGEHSRTAAAAECEERNKSHRQIKTRTREKKERAEKKRDENKRPNENENENGLWVCSSYFLSLFRRSHINSQMAISRYCSARGDGCVYAAVLLCMRACLP